MHLAQACALHRTSLWGIPAVKAKFIVALFVRRKHVFMRLVWIGAVDIQVSSRLARRHFAVCAAWLSPRS
ncbi:hypothetical protein BN2475_80009 [Paraburkholderia ribeironis]|uniref:Uncharacterized protein n=1 Tax=Paraburkholderia ribeironis TaxID=1247936 RepID=A0A1N7RM57_9BURK|nr:hypothetical protein BN2475_80009 [Paraburkholderia ribeironis]